MRVASSPAIAATTGDQQQRFGDGPADLDHGVDEPFQSHPVNETADRDDERTVCRQVQPLARLAPRPIHAVPVRVDTPRAR